MYGNYNNQAQTTPSVNTRLMTLYSDLSCLQIGLWNNNVSIKMNVAKGKNSDGIMQYDFDNRISTALVPDRIDEIVDFMGREIIPEMDKARKGEPITPKSIAFDVGKGKTTRFSIEYTPDENDVPSAYLCLYTNIGANGIPGNVVKYKFNKTEFISGYDPKTGDGEVFTEEKELQSFFNVLVNTIHLVSDQTYIGHGNKVYEMNNQRSQQNSNGGASYSQPTQNYNAPVTTASSGDDYPF